MKTDVTIAGGGLAGLTLALQLRARCPDLDVVVLERRRHPVPVAAYKVGESSVEIAAHYFDQVLGLGEHLETCQIRKFGFRFFFSDGRTHIDRVTELGASRYLATPSYQIDRGIFENFLAERAVAQGVRFLDGAVIPSLVPGRDGSHHELSFERDGEQTQLQARWLIDATGRAGLIRRQLGLGRSNGHDANSVWFRIATRIDVDDWSDDADWKARCDPPERWRSTVHLVGEGYWVWLIPLASGSHSVGIVADAKRHPLREMNTFNRALDWLGRHQPRLAAVLVAKRDLLQDFASLRGYSYACRQLYSGDRWALTGEAGAFLDPFYSPGSDFIAISNTYITDLIARDRAGEPYAAHARLYEQFFQSFYDSMLSLYRDQFDLFGDPQVLPVKVIWDYTYYWGVLCQLWFQRRLTDLRMLARVRPLLTGSLELNDAMQGFLRAWSAVSARENPAVLLDQAALPWFAELNRGLTDPLDDAAFERRLQTTTAQLRMLAFEIVARARAEHRQLDASAVESCLASTAVPVGTAARMLFPEPRLVSAA